MGRVALPANPAAPPSSSAIGDAIYVATPSTPATIAGTNIIYQEPQSGRAAPVNELTSVQQVSQSSCYSYCDLCLSISDFFGNLSHPLSAREFYLTLSHAIVFVTYCLLKDSLVVDRSCHRRSSLQLDRRYWLFRSVSLQWTCLSLAILNLSA